jgi:lysophospholipid acyltransferase (LPLAT)-like uncharacterized protein
MSKRSTGKGFIPFRQSFLIRLLLSPLGAIYRLWTISIRLDYKEQNGRSELNKQSQALVIFLWHNRLFLAGEWHHRFRKQKQCFGLISASRDGAWLETFYGWAGIRPIRGSQNRRGSQAVRELVKVVKSGNDVGITPDGSRGPKYDAKTGAIALARITKKPILLLSFEYSKCFRFNSWDKFVVPYPFSKVIVRTRVLSRDKLFDAGTDLDATTLARESLMELTID